MVKVITYGTFDLLHYGHIRLLERAKALGDYLVVGVTADDFDKSRGKINVQQSLMERVEAVRATGLADKIIIEEYEGQKIDDIKMLGIDIFTVGSDWIGKFDYLNDYCKVVYLDRTEGVSSTDIRTQNRKIKLALLGEKRITHKFLQESEFVNGIEAYEVDEKSDYDTILAECDAVYLVTKPSDHYTQIKRALEYGRHVLCEAPISLSGKQSEELYSLAASNNCILMEGIKTAYSTAYSRLVLMAKTGKIGEIVSVDATATSLIEIENINNNMIDNTWNSITSWAPTALLPVFQLLGVDYKEKFIVSKLLNESFDVFTKIDLMYENAVASIKVGKGVKSEGELVISGTKGYIYVPAPWWKTDYFEIRYENHSDNKRYFYQLEGEGIRNELVAFLKAIEYRITGSVIERDISQAICSVIEDFYAKKDFYSIS